VTTAGSYVLVLCLDRYTTIAVGRLGTFSFPAGYYCYAGSARGPGGLPARLARHLRKRKNLHWHIDYLLERTSIVEIWHAQSPERLECVWARALLSLTGAQVSFRGFGSSDCSCLTHLLYVAPSTLPALHRRLQTVGATLWDREDTAHKTL
jgi:Uri superfamily endonuclease